METFRAEFCELVCQILPQAPASLAPNDAPAMPGLAPRLGEPIADAILAKFWVAQREHAVYPYRPPATPQDDSLVVRFSYAIDANGRCRRTIVEPPRNPCSPSTTDAAESVEGAD